MMTTAGDKAAFADMYNQHFGQVSRYVLRRIDRSLHEDVVADVFTIAWQRWPNLPADPLPWLFVTARNVMGNAMRRQNKASKTLDIKSNVVGVEVHVVAKDRISKCFGQLSASDREVLSLIAFDGLETNQAARVIGCSIMTFHVRLHRARARMERALETYDELHHSEGES